MPGPAAPPPTTTAIPPTACRSAFPFRSTACRRNSFRLSTNGFVQFTTTALGSANALLPAASIAGPAIFLFWDDLQLDRNGQTANQVLYRCFGDYTVIEYDSVGVYASACGAGGPNNTLKCELLLFASGAMKFQYHTVAVCNAADSLMTVGVQAGGAAGSASLTYCAGTATQSFSGPALTGGRAIWFVPLAATYNAACGPLLSPTTDAVFDPGATVTVTATVRSIGSSAGIIPVKYRFNGGAMTEEATAWLARWQAETHTFALPLTLPATNGAYPLTVWCDLPGDKNHSDDTLTVTLTVLGGASCAGSVLLEGAGPDSAVFNNGGAGDNSPGVSCYTTTRSDMVFRRDVAPGHTVTFWLSSLGWTSKYLIATLRWGGACPGATVVDCPSYMTTAPAYNRRFTWTNSTGTAQTAYFTLGGYYAGASYCGPFTLAWQDQVAPLVTLPYTQGFETVPFVPTLPDAWTQENGDGVSPVWESYATNPHGGTKCATLGPQAAGNNDWLFSPGFAALEGNTYLMTCWRRVGAASAPDSLEVRAGLQPTAAAMTLSVLAPDTCKRTAYTQKLGAFKCPQNGVYYIGWHSLSRGGSARTYLDDITIDGIQGGCAPPWVFAANAARGVDSVTLTTTIEGGWGGVPRYQWYSGIGCAEANRMAGATASSLTTTLSGVYSCRVYILDSTVCAACDSALATVVHCGESLPWITTLDDAPVPALPLCWTRSDGNGDGRAWSSSTTNSLSLPANLYCPYSSGSAADDWLFSPPLPMDSVRNYILYYAYRAALTGYTEALELRLGRAPTAAAMTQALESVFTFTATAWDERMVVFTTPPLPGPYYLGWHCVSAANQGGVRLDNISLDRYYIGCISPPQLTVSAGAAPGAVTLTASAWGGFGPPIQYQWYAGPACVSGQEISGAADSTYTTTTTGSYACRVWRMGTDSTFCMMCDSGYADVQPCLGPEGLVVAFAGEEELSLRLTFSAPQSGLYAIYSATAPTNDGDPRGNDPQWTLETTLAVAAPGAATWTDPALPGSYKNFVVVQLCPPFAAP